MSWALTYGGVTGNLVKWVLIWTSLAFIGGWRLMRAPSGGGDQPLSVPLTDDGTERKPADDSGAPPRNRTYRARIVPYALQPGHA